MHLEQQGPLLSGTMEEISLTNPNLFVLLRITGKLRGDSLQLFDLSVISESSPKNIRWCRKLRRGIVYRSVEGLRFEGSWENDGNNVFKKTKLRNNIGNPCLPGSFMLYRKTPVDSILAAPKTDPLSPGPRKTASPEEKTLAKVAARKDVTRQRIEVFSDSIRLQFYDNGEIDGDTITVIYNGVVLLSHRGLTARPVDIWIKVARGSENKLQMFADNVGSIPPNTALLIFYDRKKQHVVRLDADAFSNAAVTVFRGEKD